MATKLVRVRLENGTEKSVPVAVAERYGYKPLNKPTHGRDGRPLPPKHRVPLGGAVSAASNTEVYVDYSGHTVAELKTEIDNRNKDRDEADWISHTGNKADLIEALEADDNAGAPASSDES